MCVTPNSEEIYTKLQCDTSFRVLRSLFYRGNNQSSVYKVMTNSDYSWCPGFLAVVLVVIGIPGSNSSCVQVYPNVWKNDYFCNRYVAYPKGYCSSIIGNAYVYGSTAYQQRTEKAMERFAFGKSVMENLYGVMIRESCMEVFNVSYCHWNFPRCDYTTGRLRSARICRETCEYLMKTCDREFEMARNFNKINQGRWPYEWTIMDCDNDMFRPKRNGGDAPSCFYIEDLITEVDKLRATDCYYGEGVGYHGNINVTKSGISCQPWSSQCPHRHYHNSTQYPELINASNFCRNPGGMGPDGPWCYTTNKLVRWEYCDVPKCPPPGPTKSPSSIRAYATGPDSILIEWKPVPLPFVHGTPQGFRIMIKEMTADRFMTSNTTGAAVLQIEFQGLKPLTKYSLVVLEFNEHRDGTPSSPVYVITMPTNSVRVRFIATFGNKLFSVQLRDRTTTEYKALEKQVKESVAGLFAKTATKLYHIHQIEVIQFTNGSVKAYFDVTAGFNQSLTDAETVSEAVVGAMVTVPRMGDLSVNQTRVIGPPPPPRNIHAVEIETTSLNVRWQAPTHSDTYSITNYTVMFKRATSSLEYQLAGLVDEETREFHLKDLESASEYKICVAAHNSHGEKKSETITALTKAKPNIALILGIGIPVVILISIAVSFSVLLWRWREKKRRLEDAFALEKANREAIEDHYQSTSDVFALLGLEGVVKEWCEIPRDDLTIERQLGSGAFGVVKKASLKIRAKATDKDEKDERIGEGRKTEEPEEEKGKVLEIVPCAVKMLKENPTESELRDLCNEIAIMALVGDHPNIVSLLGACTVNGPLWLVVKLAENGCFLDYIKEHRSVAEYENTENKIHSYENVTEKTQGAPMTEKEKFKFAYEIAKGMRHLEKKKVASDVRNSEQVVYNLRRGRTIRPFPTNQQRTRQLRRQPSPTRVRTPTAQSTEETSRNLAQLSLLQRRGHPPLPRLRLRLTPPQPSPPQPSRITPPPSDQQGPEVQSQMEAGNVRNIMERMSVNHPTSRPSFVDPRIYEQVRAHIDAVVQRHVNSIESPAQIAHLPTEEEIEEFQRFSLGLIMDTYYE